MVKKKKDRCEEAFHCKGEVKGEVRELNGQPPWPRPPTVHPVAGDY